MTLQTLWQSNQHCAFTDLVYYNQTWYCVFREGSTHMSLDGCIVVLTSDNAVSWHKHSVLSWQGGDLRDPKLSVAPNNTLIITAGIRWAVATTKASQIYSVAWLLADPLQDWLAPVLDTTSEGTWRWATTWHQSFAYSVGYAGHDQQGCLYRSKDGLNWQAWIKPFFPKAKVLSNESSLVSHGETLLCLTRRDKAGGAKALLGMTGAYHQSWTWKTLPVAIGGPKLLRLSNGEWVMAVRRINYKRVTAKTRLYKLNPTTGRVTLWRTLPSGGDCSYAGMVEKEGHLYVSYYSSHLNQQTVIFLAVIKLNSKRRSQAFQ